MDVGPPIADEPLFVQLTGSLAPLRAPSIRGWAMSGVTGGEVGTLIGHEAAILAQVVGYLHARAPREAWSENAKRALCGVLARGGGEIEQAKAIRLPKHVFGGLHWPEADPAHQFDACAERLRTDLANIVPAGAGLYLSPYE